MAEAFGVVVGCIAVVEVAAKIGIQVLAIKQLLPGDQRRTWHHEISYI